MKNNLELYRHDIKIIYKLFIKFIRRYYTDIIIDYTSMIFFKKCKKCYDLINCIYNEKYKTNKDYFINFLNKFKLSVNILYKLNEACLDKLKMFFNEKFEIDVKIEKRIEINYKKLLINMIPKL